MQQGTSKQGIKSASKRVVLKRGRTSVTPKPLRVKSGTQATVTLKHLAVNLSKSHELSKEQAKTMLGDLVNLVTKHLKKGDRIRIGGLGVLVVRKGRRRRELQRDATAEVQIHELKKGVAPALVGVVEDRVASTLLAEEPLQSAYDPSARAQALLRGKKIVENDLKDSGGAYTLQDVETLLGISRQAIDKKVQNDALLVIPGPHGRRRYPAVQFMNYDTVPGLRNVLKSLPSANGWFRLNFLVTPDSHLAGRRPIDLLKEGNIEPVLTAAKAVGVQGA